MKREKRLVWLYYKIKLNNINMKWLELLYKFNTVKKLVRKQNALLKYPKLQDYFKSNDLEKLLKKNKKFIKKYKHAVAVHQQSTLIYNLYFKTSYEKDDGINNIEIDKTNKIYAYHTGEQVHFQTEIEFINYFEILKNSDLDMQKRLFTKEEDQNLFLEKLKSTYNDVLLIDGTDQFYFEDKLVEYFCLENIDKENYAEKLNELEDIIQTFHLEWDANIKEDIKNQSLMFDE